MAVFNAFNGTSSGRGFRLSLAHLLAALIAFGGLLLATINKLEIAFRWFPSYAFALAAAFVWDTYSIFEAGSRRTSAIDVGPACTASGLLALAPHMVVEQPVVATPSQWVNLSALGAGPTGGAFYLWSYAMRKGDARLIAVLSNLTPLLSTAALLASHGQAPTFALGMACVMVTMASAAVLAINRGGNHHTESPSHDSARTV